MCNARVCARMRNARVCASICNARVCEQVSEERARSAAILEASQKANAIVQVHEGCGHERALLMRKLDESSSVERQLRAKVLEQAHVSVFVCVCVCVCVVLVRVYVWPSCA